MCRWLHGTRPFIIKCHCRWYLENGVVMAAAICDLSMGDCGAFVCSSRRERLHNNIQVHGTGRAAPIRGVWLHNLNPDSLVHLTHYFSVNLYKLLLLANSLAPIYVHWPPWFITAAVTPQWLTLLISTMCPCVNVCIYVLCIRAGKLFAVAWRLLTHTQACTQSSNLWLPISKKPWLL